MVRLSDFDFFVEGGSGGTGQLGETQLTCVRWQQRLWEEILVKLQHCLTWKVE